MTTKDSYAPGTPCWVDLASPDLVTSVAFYRGLFGWEAPELPPEAGGYRMFERGGVPVAGAGPVMFPDQPVAWTTYVCVDDAETTSSAIVAAGGTILVAPMDVLDVGRMCVFLDPTGATGALWQPRAHKGAGVVNEPGALCWNELATGQPDLAVAFYGAVFDWRASTVEVGDAPYTEWKLGDDTVAGMRPMPEEAPAEVGAHWLPYFAVDDCDATVAAGRAAGAGVAVPPTDIPPGRFAVLDDPTGAVFAVIALAGPV